MRSTIGMCLGAAIAVATPASASEIDQKVVEAFKGGFAHYCITLQPEISIQPLEDPIVNEIRFNWTFDEAGAEPTIWHLYEFACTQGAYNFGSVFFIRTDYEEIYPVQFAEPDYQTIREDPEDFESPVMDLEITGYSVTTSLVFPEFDPETNTLSMFVKYRGLGDASASGTWVFRDGDFRLDTYFVDASYDGEINAIQIYPRR